MSYFLPQSTDGKLNKDFKWTRTEEQVFTALRKFIDKDNHIVKVQYNTYTLQFRSCRFLWIISFHLVLFFIYRQNF